ncbi:IclR family transcriptional regulator domain-containing protein [Novosphingobium sp.]|uniref:IclR family transcriptional regulator domain-containing protein n=1 Tax=Novosphingobium sp. TaxID=1874826 RepID=UPI002FE2B83A
MSSSDPNFMQSLARGLTVLEAFADLGPGQSVASLASHTGLPRGVVARCLHTLAATGYVSQDGRQFAVRPRVLRLAETYLSDRSLSALAQPILEQLRDKLGESCSLGVLDGTDILYVARASRSRIMAIGLHVGSRLPAWCTSMGRVLLSALPPREREALLPGELTAHTNHTITDRVRLSDILNIVAREDFALIDQELEIGLRSIAVPVRDRQSRVIAALNVGVNALEHSTEKLQAVVLPCLRDAATQLGAVAGDVIT